MKHPCRNQVTAAKSGSQRGNASGSASILRSTGIIYLRFAEQAKRLSMGTVSTVVSAFKRPSPLNQFSCPPGKSHYPRTMPRPEKRLSEARFAWVVESPFEDPRQPFEMGFLFALPGQLVNRRLASCDAAEIFDHRAKRSGNCFHCDATRLSRYLRRCWWNRIVKIST